MKTIKLKLPVFAILLFFATSCCLDCFTIRGNGIEESEYRYAGNFSKVKSSGSFDVHVTNGDEYEVIVIAETNILPYIETNVNGNTLSIGISGIHNVKNTLPMEVFISTPVLEGLKESGSGQITTNFFESYHFDVSISGSGRIETAVECHDIETSVSGSGKIYLSGVADYAEHNISGSGMIDAYDLVTWDSQASISGSGDVYTNVEHLLEASISGSGNVFFIGSPTVIKHISGSGNVINDN